MRILHCLRAPVGGLFRHVCDLAGGQAARGHAVGIVADSEGGGAAAAERFKALEAACELGVTRFPVSRLPGPGDLLAARRIATIARAKSVDVLHGHGAKGGAHARLAPASGLRGALRVYTPHGGSLHYSRSTPSGLVFLTMEGALLRRTGLLLFESDYGRRTYTAKVGTPSCPVEIVHNGLAASEFVPAKPAPEAADFLFVGELRYLKGVDIFLHALNELKSNGMPPTAVIVGAGEARAELETLAGRLGLTDQVRFAGLMPAHEAFTLGRCLVVPSRAESLPYIVLEGIAAGLPVVATRVGGIPEILGDRADRLVPPDDVGGLSRAMGSMFADPDAAQTEATRFAGELARRFSVDGMVDAVLAAYGKAQSLRSD